MTTAPSALTGLLAALMLAIGVYCASRPLTARWLRRSTYADVDVMHAVMGVGMAGMLLPWLNPFQPVVWEAAFAAGAAWFGARAGWARREPRATAGARAGRSCSATAPGGCAPAAHLLSCGAMLYMLTTAARGGVAVAPGGRAAGAAVMAARPGFLAVVLAAAVAVSVVVATDRLAPGGPAQAARPAPAQLAPAQPGPLLSGSVPPGADESRQGGAGRGRPGRFGRFVNAGRGRGPGLCPRVASCCQIGMGITMAYMLIQMG